MGVLNAVLSQLSPAVGCNSEAIHVDCQQVQQGLGRRCTEDEDEERRERKKFCEALGASMCAIAIGEKENSVRKEEEACFKCKLMKLEAEDKTKIAVVEKYICASKKRIETLESELSKMKAQQGDEMAAENTRKNGNNGTRKKKSKKPDTDKEDNEEDEEDDEHST